MNNSESLALLECTGFFEDVTNKNYINAQQVCKLRGCQDPISRELLPPDNYDYNIKNRVSKGRKDILQVS